MTSLSPSSARTHFGLARRALALAAFAALGFGAAHGQTPITAGPVELATGALVHPQAHRPMLCPHPYVVNINKNAGPTAVNAADLPPGARANEMTYSDTRVNKFFTDTIAWRLPGKEMCCEYSTARVSWTVQNKANNSLQTNDSSGLYFNGQPVVSFAINNLPLNGTQVFSHTLTPAQVQNGRITLVVQDDTAVTNFSVQIQACCVRPTR